MMHFEVKEYRFFTGTDPVPFKEANAWDRKNRIVPRVIVLHDTAGWLTPFNTVAWFQDKKCTVSAHAVVERDGTVTQMVPLDRRAFHAGKSVYKGKKDVNYFSIGIEIVNPGCLTSAGKAHFHKKKADYFPKDQIVQRTTKAHGPGYWLPYTTEQIDTVISMCRALVKAYPTITDITTHVEIAPGRKVDVNPLFPIELVREAVFKKVEKPAVAKLEYGVNGKHVIPVQERLRDLGYYVGEINEEYGPRTRNAVLAFEAENGLKTDGILDDAERDLLFSDAAKSMPVPTAVTATPAELAKRGSRVIQVTQFCKRLIRRIAAGLGLSVGGDVALNDGQTVTAVLDQADKVRTVASRGVELIGWVKTDIGVAVLTVGLIVLGIYGLLYLIEKWGTDDARAGAGVTV